VLLRSLDNLKSLQSELVKILKFRLVEFDYRGLVTIQEIEDELKSWRRRAGMAERLQNFELLDQLRKGWKFWKGS
jgi:hypothetical protein